MLVIGLVFLAVFSQTKAITIRHENSLMGPYIAGGTNLVHWDLTGSAQLDAGCVRLTTDEPDKQGAIWNSFPSLSNSWEFQINFHIHGKSVHLNGDGMALWYVDEGDMLQSGPVFGSKNYFTGLGVFIDTFADQEEPHKHRHPYISAMVNNGSLHYEHDEDGTMTQIGGCHAAVRNLDVPTKIAVSYIKEILTVYVDNEGLGMWKLCFKREKVHLPTGYYFGISASTSDVTDNHDVLQITSLNMDPDNKEWIDRSDIIPEVEDLHIPEEYNRDFIEDELQLIEKREAMDEMVDDKREEKLSETKQSETKQSETHKSETKKRETKETAQEDISPPTSIWRKLIYITGALIIILVSISVFKKYNERRKEILQKRLY